MPKFAEFFAGVGLVREAVEPLGWECAFANDISSQKAEMYIGRFGALDLRVDDVQRLTTQDIPDGIDLVTASFPCIDLSLAGNRNGIDGADSGAFWPFMKLLGEYCRVNKPPRAVLLENVVGFISSNGGDDLRRAIAALNDLGYRCDIVQVNAKWFVPQSRPRLFVLALRDGDSRMRAFPTLAESRLRPPAIQKFLRRERSLKLGTVDLPEPPEACLDTVVDLLEDRTDAVDEWWPQEKVANLVASMNPRHRERIDNVLASDGKTAGTIYRRVRNGRTVGEIRTDGIAGCLRTPSGGSSIQFLAVSVADGLRIRRLTGREYARLQGVPDDFPVKVPDRQAMFGFGDAVCVPAVRWLVNAAFRHLTNSDGYATATGDVSQGRLMETSNRANGAAFKYEPRPAPEDQFTVAERSEIMRRVKSKDTKPEIELRQALWRFGLRYRKNAHDLPGTPDIVFRGAKLAVFVDGEFWHGKKLSRARLSQMKPYWQQKIARNVKRDEVVNEELTQIGWRVLRVGSKAVNVEGTEITHLISNLLHQGELPQLPVGVEFYQPTERGVLASV